MLVAESNSIASWFGFGPQSRSATAGSLVGGHRKADTRNNGNAWLDEACEDVWTYKHTD